MSDDAALVDLKDFADFKMGETIIAADCTGDGLPIFSADTGTAPWNFSSKCRVRNRRGSLVIGARGSIGNTRLPDFDEFAATQTTIVLDPNRNTFDPKFLFYELSSLDFYSLAAQQAVPMLTIGDLRRVRVHKPRIEVQRRIAEILSTVDEAIKQTEALVGKWQQMKAGLMHDLFTRGVTPEDHLRPTRTQAPHLYQDSPIGWIPKAWNVKSFRSVLTANLQNGYFKKPELVGRGYKLVNVSELYQPLGIDTDHEDVERVEATPADIQRYGVAEGDLFFTRSSLVLSGIAQCNVMLQLREPTLFECHVIRARPNEKEADPAFLGLYFQTPRARSELMARAKHTTMTTISQPDILAVPILKPPLDEQKQISHRIAVFWGAIHAEEAKLTKLRQQKNGLLQDLLTGSVRVSTE